VLWTAFLVLLIFWLMAFSIQVGWLLIHSLLSIASALVAPLLPWTATPPSFPTCLPQ